MSKQVPDNLLSILQSHLPLQDSDFLRGFVSCLSYQYPDSDLQNFYDNYDYSDSETFKRYLFNFLDTQSFS